MVENIGSQHVLAPSSHSRAFVPEFVLEHKRHAGLWFDACFNKSDLTARAVNIAEDRLTAIAIVVQINQNGEAAFLARLRRDRTVLMAFKVLPWIVSLHCELLVEPQRPPTLEFCWDQ